MIMPYKFESDHVKLPESLDRRRKIPGSEHAIIKRLHAAGMAIRAIERRYKVSHGLVGKILFPERLARHRRLYRERGGWRRYYKGGAAWAATISEHRHYKQQVLKTQAPG